MKKRMIVTVAAAAFVWTFGVNSVTAQSSGESSRSVTMAILKQKVVESQEMVNESKRAIAQATATYQQVKKQYSKARSESLRKGVTPESFPEIMKLLQTQKVQLSIDIAGLEVRLESLQQMAKATEKNNQSKEGEGAIKRLFDLQQQRLGVAKKLVDSGRLSRQEYRAAEIAMVEAEIRLHDAQRPKLVPGTVIDAMMGVSLDRAEKKARLEKVESLLEQLSGVPKVLDEDLSLRSKVDALRSQMNFFELELNEADAALRRQRRKLAEFEESTVD